jgi:hypothetical protein
LLGFQRNSAPVTGLSARGCCPGPQGPPAGWLTTSSSQVAVWVVRPSGNASVYQDGPIVEARSGQLLAEPMTPAVRACQLGAGMQRAAPVHKLE